MKKLLGIFNFSTFRFYYEHLGYRLIIQMLFSVFISVLDSLGLSMFFPILEMVSSGNAINENEKSKIYIYLEKFFQFLHLELNLPNILFLLILFFISKGICQYFYNIYFTNVRHSFIRDLRIKLIDKINNYSYKNFVTADVGRIQNSLTGEIDRLANSYVNYFSMMQNLIFVIIYMVCVFVIDMKFALLVVIGGIITNLFFNKIFNYTKTEANSLTSKNHSLQGFILQFIGNFKYLKATNKNFEFSELLKENIYKIETNSRKIGKLGAIVSSLREPSLIILISIIIIVQISVFDGGISTILLSLVFFYRAFGYLMVLQNYYNNYLASYGSINNIFEFIDELDKGQENYGNKVSFEKILNAIELKNIDFYYHPNDLIIKNVSLTIHSKESIAFVGESGSGKTTLANIISGLFSPSSGEILIDGKNIKDLNINEYRSKIGYITQESVIFNDTIYNNISFWKDKNEENKKAFQKAIESSSLVEFIDSIPQKEETVLGNNGVNLSGGQRQRISIARELFKEAELLILDEATSALDSETEKEVQKNIEILKGKSTLIVIAHRLSTIKNMDKIVLMSKGQILDMGSFDELMQKSPIFRNMVNLQEIS